MTIADEYHKAVMKLDRLERKASEQRAIVNQIYNRLLQSPFEQRFRTGERSSDTSTGGT